MVGNPPHAKRTPRVLVVCATCGNEFKVYPSRLRIGKGKYCGLPCAAKGLSNRPRNWHSMLGKKHRPESIEKMRASHRQSAVYGPKNPNWKGGRTIGGGGYVQLSMLLLSDEERLLFCSMISSDHYIPEHRLVLARHLGRPLLRSEIVHHRNGVKTDNRLGNLEMCDNHTHKRSHQKILKELKDLRMENELLKERLMGTG